MGNHVLVITRDERALALLAEINGVDRQTNVLENRKTWVAALRSGNYDQGRGQLRGVNKGGYSCLGVACDVSGLGEWKYRTISGMGCYAYLGKRYFLPAPVEKWLGLTPDAYVQLKDGAWRPLSGLNDSGTSFDEIADIIEAQPDDWDGRIRNDD